MMSVNDPNRFPFTMSSNSTCIANISLQLQHALQINHDKADTLQHEVVLQFSDDGKIIEEWKRFTSDDALQQTVQCSSISYASCNTWFSIFDKSISRVFHYCSKCYKKYVDDGTMLQLQRQNVGLYCFRIHVHASYHYHCWGCGRTTERTTCDLHQIFSLHDIHFIWESKCLQCYDAEENDWDAYYNKTN